MNFTRKDLIDVVKYWERSGERHNITALRETFSMLEDDKYEYTMDTMLDDLLCKYPVSIVYFFVDLYLAGVAAGMVHQACNPADAYAIALSVKDKKELADEGRRYTRPWHLQARLRFD